MNHFGRRTAGGGGGDGGRRVSLFSPCEKMGQNLPKKLLLLIYIHFLRGEPVHAEMVQISLNYQLRKTKSGKYTGIKCGDSAQKPPKTPDDRCRRPSER